MTRSFRVLVLCCLFVAPVVGCGDPADTQTKAATGVQSKVISSGKKSMVQDKAD